MFLYNLSLHKATAVTQAIFGNFSAPKAQEVVVARGKVLELLRPDDETGKVQSVLSTEVFGIIRTLIPFRLVGGNRDYIIVGSDSGRISVLQYDPDKNAFTKVHEETYGKSGCRRIVPGEYLAVDPKGRACMIGAIEKQKFVYVLNRDAAANLTISSPLETHKSSTICFSMCGLDVGFENPMFACLEASYNDAEDDDDDDDAAAAMPDKMLTYYELDLGLNNVTRRWSEPVDPHANILIPVPGGNDGPGGVLICAENKIQYYNEDHDLLTCAIPRRYGMDDSQGVLIVSYATHTQKNLFFFLVQSEFGDIYKVTLTYEEDTVDDVHVKYFDTVPTATSLCVLKTGFLFVASETANHYLFQFTGIGDEDDETVISTTKDAADDVNLFQPRGLTNLALVDEMESLSSCQNMLVEDLVQEHTPQIYTLCGRAARSSLRVLRHGLAVSEMAVSDLPGNPNAVWAVKQNRQDEHHAYIVVSFANATIVLSVGETVQEVNDSGVLGTVPTLSMSTLGSNSLLQIYPSGIRHIRADKRKTEWSPPGKKQIVHCASNETQVVVALTGGEIVYFELNQTGDLFDVHRKEMGSEVSALALGPVPQDRQRSEFLVVGSHDNTLRVLSCDPAKMGDQLTLQALPAVPTHLAMVNMLGSRRDGSEQQYLYAGLQNGILIRSRLDESDGSLQDSRKRFLGTRPVQLHEVTVDGRPAVMALSSRSWLSYTFQGRFHMTPLSYDTLEAASSFASEQCPEGIVAISGSTLRIVLLERLGDLFNQTVLPLRYTPRKMVSHPKTKDLIIVESDHHSYPWAMKVELQKSLLGEDDDDEGGDGMEGVTKVKKEKPASNGNGMQDDDDDDSDDDEDEGPQEPFIGYPQAVKGTWASCIRVVDPQQCDTKFLLELEDNEAAFSLTVVEFKQKPSVVGGGMMDGSGAGVTEQYLAVGTVKDLQVSPRKLTAGYIHLYRFKEDGALELVHKTETDDVVLAMTPYQGRLLVGVGSALRIYDLGKKKLLRKCENKNFPTTIQSITVQGDRIYVGDQCEAFHFVTYDKAEKRLKIFADNDAPRYLTAVTPLDYDTMCGADKFGNVFVSRLPADVSSLIEKDPTGGKLTDYYGASLASAIKPQHKLQDIVQCHVGEMVTSLQKVSLVAGGLEVVFYSTLLGGLGMLAPFRSKEDVEFFSLLEMHLRQESSPLCGRDHLAFRSSYFPVKSCIDGDLCETFTTLPYKKQEHIAGELLCTPAEVAKKLEEIRNRVL